MHDDPHVSFSERSRNFSDPGPRHRSRRTAGGAWAGAFPVCSIPERRAQPVRRVRRQAPWGRTRRRTEYESDIAVRTFRYLCEPVSDIEPDPRHFRAIRALAQHLPSTGTGKCAGGKRAVVRNDSASPASSGGSRGRPHGSGAGHPNRPARGARVSGRIVERILLVAGFTVVVSACQAPAPRGLSRGHLAEQVQAEVSRIPAPVRRTSFVPPPVPSAARRRTPWWSTKCPRRICSSP